jgi:hypothetical protein
MALAFWAPKRQPAQKKNIRPLEESIVSYIPSSSVVSVWSMLGAEVQAGQHRAPWLLACSLPLQDDVRTNVFLTLLWHLWTARNSKNLWATNLAPTSSQAGSAGPTPRYRRSSIHIQAWRDFISSCFSSPGLSGMLCNYTFSCKYIWKVGGDLPRICLGKKKRLEW